MSDVVSAGADITICVGTIGGGIHVSHDGGGSFTQIAEKVPFEGNVRSLRVSPHDPRQIWAGSDVGLFRSDDGGSRWHYVSSPANGRELWSIGIDPTDPQRVYVGARPGGFRSTDGGESWTEMAMSVSEECFIGHPRTTNMVVDPRDPMIVWAGVEIDGVHRSDDGGDSWRRVGDLGPSSFSGDVHGLAVRPAGDGASVVLHAGTPFGVSTSLDEGETWTLQQFPGLLPGDKRSYCRHVMCKADDPNTLFVGTGNTIPGEIGGLQVSRDGGATWTAAELPVTPRSVLYWFATHPARPEVIAAASLYGYLYLSTDGGASWSKAAREFGEIRALAVTVHD